MMYSCKFDKNQPISSRDILHTRKSANQFKKHPAYKKISQLVQETSCRQENQPISSRDFLHTRKSANHDQFKRHPAYKKISYPAYKKISQSWSVQETSCIQENQPISSRKFCIQENQPTGSTDILLTRNHHANSNKTWTKSSTHFISNGWHNLFKWCTSYSIIEITGFKIDSAWFIQA